MPSALRCHQLPDSNKATRWKEENGLLYYANCPHSPDLTPMENCWQVPKQTIGRQSHWNDATCIAAINEGWAKLSQETINKWVEEMPKRLHDVMDARSLNSCIIASIKFECVVEAIVDR